MINYFKNLIKGKTLVFYIGAGLALLSIIGGFLYVGAFISPEDSTLAAAYNAWIPTLLILSGLIYYVAAIFKYDNYGLGLLGLSSFASFLIFIVSFIPYGFDVGTRIGMGEDASSTLFATEGIVPGVVLIIFLLIIMIAGNVLAWIPANSKKNKNNEFTDSETTESYY